MKYLYTATRINRVVLLSGLAIQATILGCGRVHTLDDYKATVRSGLRVIPESRQVEQFFGQGVHFITEYGFDEKSPRVWNTDVYFGGRYNIVMQVHVMIDYEKNEISSVVDSPKFYLFACSEIYFDNGQVGAHYVGSQQRTLSEDEWKQVVAANGDLSVVGYSTSLLPIENFDAFVRAATKDDIDVH